MSLDNNQSTSDRMSADERQEHEFLAPTNGGSSVDAEDGSTGDGGEKGDVLLPEEEKDIMALMDKAEIAIRESEDGQRRAMILKHKQVMELDTLKQELERLGKIEAEREVEQAAKYEAFIEVYNGCERHCQRISAHSAVFQSYKKAIDAATATNNELISQFRCRVAAQTELMEKCERLAERQAHTQQSMEHEIQQRFDAVNAVLQELENIDNSRMDEAQQQLDSLTVALSETEVKKQDQQARMADLDSQIEQVNQRNAERQQQLSDKLSSICDQEAVVERQKRQRSELEEQLAYEQLSVQKVEECVEQAKGSIEQVKLSIADYNDELDSKLSHLHSLAQSKLEEERSVVEKIAEERALYEKLVEERELAEKLAEERALAQKLAEERALAEAAKRAEERALAQKLAEERALAEAAKRAEERALAQKLAEERAEAEAAKRAEERALAQKLAEERAEAEAAKRAEERALAEAKYAEERALAQKRAEERELAEAKRVEERAKRAEERALAHKRAEERSLAQKRAEERSLAQKRAEERSLAEAKRAEERSLAQKRAEERSLAEAKRAEERSLAQAKLAEERSLAHPKFSPARSLLSESKQVSYKIDSSHPMAKHKYQMLGKLDDKQKSVLKPGTGSQYRTPLALASGGRTNSSSSDLQTPQEKGTTGGKFYQNRTAGTQQSTPYTRTPVSSTKKPSHWQNLLKKRAVVKTVKRHDKRKDDVYSIFGSEFSD